MKTFEGIMTIKWYKNDNGDARGITIDTESRKTLNDELKEIRRKFMKEQDPESDEARLAHEKLTADGIVDKNGCVRVTYSVKFEMNERK